MKDRQPTQVLANGAIRYGVYNADGSLNHYEYLKREDAPTVEGTPLNKANLLSDATAVKLWPNASTRPEDPTVNDALGKLSEGTAKVGDIAITSRTDLSDAWLPCDGRYISAGQYPELFNVLRVSASAAPWSIESLPTYTGSINLSTDGMLSYANNYWFYAVKGSLYYSADLISWTDITPSDLNRYGDLAIKIRNYLEMHYWKGQYVCAVYLSTNDHTDPDKYMCLYTDTLQKTGWKLSYIVNKFDTTPYANDEINRTLLFDGTTYYFAYTAYASGSSQSTSVIYYTTELAENASGEYGTGWAASGNVATQFLARYYDVDSGYFYGVRIYNLDNYSNVTGIVRSRDLQSESNWSELSGLGHVSSIQAFAVKGNDIAFVTYSSSSTQIYRSTDMGETFTRLLTTTAQQSEFLNKIALVSGIICAWGGTGHKNIYIIDADGEDVQIVTGDTSLGALFAYSTNAIAICSSSLTSVVHQDFTYKNKKIPAITPDNRSKAYIKALEE